MACPAYNVREKAVKTGAYLAALALPAAAFAQVAGSGLTNYGEIPKPEPLRETVFGVTIDDPYRWMEKADRRAGLEAWVNASSLHTTTELAALPGREPLIRALEAASRSTDSFNQVKLAGGALFFLKLSRERNAPALYVREGGRERLFLDPLAGRDESRPRAIGGFSVSPGGRLIAIQMSEGGSEVGEIRFYDVATGKEQGDVLGPAWGAGSIDWFDDTTVAYAQMREQRPGEDGMRGERTTVHIIGTPTAQDRPVLGMGIDSGLAITEKEVPYFAIDPTSRFATAGAGGARADTPLAIGTAAALKAGKPDFRQIATLDDRINGFELVGNTLYYQTSKADSDGEIRSIDLTGPWSLAASKPVIGGIGVITGFAATIDGVYVIAQSPYAATKVHYLPNGGKRIEVPLPFIGSGYSYATSADRRTFTFGYDGYQRSTIFYRIDQGRLAPLGIEATTLPEAARLTVAEDWAVSADGTKVPLTIVSSGARTGPRPTILEAYASYGRSAEPYYSTSTTVWASRGGVHASCHARGGGELGRAWHEGGRSANKPNAQADLIACGKRLIELGYASPKTLGIFGASAGGLLIPMAALKSPELFAAVVTRVGIVNPTRLGVANNGANQFDEMGDPRTAAGFTALAAQDSTLALPSVRRGTDFLFTIGLNDKRVEPWMSAKLVAMMRGQWGDRQLVLIRSDGKAGHGMGSTRNQRLEEQADIFAFFLNRFGQAGFVR
jgi:prolyl oligopeptidase